MTCRTPHVRVSLVLVQKAEVEDYIEGKTNGTQTSYTYVYVNAFLDYGVTHGNIMDLKGKKVQLVDGGETPFTTSPLPYVGKATVAVLKHPEETANRPVRTNGAVVTQKQLLAYAQKHMGTEGWDISDVTSEQLEHEGLHIYQTNPSNAFGWIMPLLKRCLYTPSYGNNFEKNNDNATLGLQQLSEQDVEELIKSLA